MPWVPHPLPLLQRVGFHTVRPTISKFRNDTRDPASIEKTSVRARLQPCRKSAEKKFFLTP